MKKPLAVVAADLKKLSTPQSSSVKGGLLPRWGAAE